MKRTLLCVLLVSACGQDGTTSHDRKALIQFAQVPNKVESIPDRDHLDFLETPCLIWNVPEVSREERRIERRNGRRTATREKRFFNDAGPAMTVGFDVTPENIAPLTLAQLRVTATYFNEPSEAARIKKQNVSDLFEENDDPFFYEILDKKTERLYTVTNIASGDTPLELVFLHGTLQPVVVTQDGDLSHCALPGTK